MHALLQSRTSPVYPLFALALAMAPVLSASRGHAQSGEQSTANAQYTRAVDAIGRKDYPEGRRLLLDLWQKSETYDVAASLGQCEFKLQNYAAAARYMSFAIANAPPMEDPDVVERFKLGLAEAKARTGTVHIRAASLPERITIDSAPLEVTAWPAEVFLNPGKHVIEAELGASASARTLQVEAQGEYDVAFELGTAKPRQAALEPGTRALETPASAGAVPSTAGSQGRSFAPVWIGGAVALSGLILGLAETARANNAKDSAAALRAETANAGASACTAPQSNALQAKCSEQQDAASRHDSATKWATGGFVVAGAAAVFSLGYLLWPAHQEASGANSTSSAANSTSSGAIAKARRANQSAKVTLMPAAGPRELGFTLVGSFE